MTVPPHAETRILIGAGSFVDATAALRIVARLAAGVNVTFGGLLIEDRDTLDMCHLPNQRVVSAGGSLVCAPSPSQLRTLMAADAKAFRRSLAEVAGPVGAAWTFEQSIGDLVQQALTASAGWDITIVGHRSVHPMRGKVISLRAATDADAALNAFSDRLATSLSAEHLVFSVGDLSRGSAGSFAFASLEEALVTLARMNVQAVLLDLSHGPVHTSDQLRRLLEVSRCSLFVFGAAALNEQLEHSTQIPPSPTRR
ncbi:hypothetical protein SAMN04487859_118100 [Roseovarius lutimaris]|uniref:Uncharacterized protein n=1 Tax=Roseovarius lutimaris TaxID=1005928 RepID=A0A1I5F6F4_9RHOB|nr:hypothetical protein [Roseovarius lutimaris]SFO19302.1 hypothetical protein SAMN04487859_118100 [Roseovarius lutimaris]